MNNDANNKIVFTGVAALEKVKKMTRGTYKKAQGKLLYSFENCIFFNVEFNFQIFTTSQNCN